MQLPFTSQQFFQVFAAFNQVFLLWIVAWWIVCLGVVAWVAREPGRRSHVLSWLLGALWLWNAIAYHAVFFTRINPAAWLFAAAFGVQAVIFVQAARGRRLEYFQTTGWTRLVGAGLVAYAFAYPFLTMAVGHRYPAAPMFGVPCPTVILTIGALLTCRGGVPGRTAVVPFVWALIGGSAAVLLDVSTDYVLAVAGLCLPVAGIARRRAESNERGITSWLHHDTR